MKSHRPSPRRLPQAKGRVPVFQPIPEKGNAMINFPNPISLLASWRGLIAQSLSFAACAAGAFSLDGEIVPAIYLLVSSAVTAGFAIWLYRDERTSRSTAL